MQSAGLIKLKKNFDSASGNTNDIVSNTKKFKFKLIDDTTGPRIIKSVDAVLIGNTIALAGNLNVLKDSLYHEKIDQSTKNNIMSWPLPRRTMPLTRSWASSTITSRSRSGSPRNTPAPKSKSTSRSPT